MKVYLVGAGPGDPGLITLKGIECIKKADVVIYDNLINKKLLEYAKKDAKLIYAGKSGKFHTMEQKEINRLIIRETRTHGKNVVRLKGGDPIIFGRGAEELEVLAKNKIKFEVVPGVSSAIAGPIYAGIPLTHREFASSVCFVTGQEDIEKKESGINWESIAGIDTTVILMGITNLKEILNKFIKSGKSLNTPVAIIQNATTGNQKVVTGNFKNIEEKARKSKITAPAIIVIGKVVDLRKKLNWFVPSEPPVLRRLSGKTIVVTRSLKQAGIFSSMLEIEGANVIEFPTIKIIPYKINKKIKVSLNNLDKYDIVIFTSVNGVEIFMDMLDSIGKKEILRKKKIYAIGPITAKAISESGFLLKGIPSEYRAEGILSIIGDVKNRRILIPRAKESREILVKDLRAKGAFVNELPIYNVEIEKNVPDKFLENLKNKKINCITFTSSSTVRNFDRLVGRFRKNLKDVKIASIGPITSDTLRKSGYRVDIQPEKYTLPDLTKAIVKNL